MFRTITKRLKMRRFAQKEDGSIAIETLIVMPMIFWVYIAMFAFFQTYLEYSNNQKAAFTIGDMISRETLPLDSDYLDGVQELLVYMTNSSAETAVRVTSLKYNLTEERFYIDWSRSRGSHQPLTNSDVALWSTRIPKLSDNEYIVITETWTTYDPPFDTGLGNQEIENFVFTRPRYAPQVHYTGST